MSGADVAIRLTAEDDASATVDSAVTNINNSYKDFISTTRTASREYITNNQQLFELGRTMTSVGRVTDKAISLFNSYNLMQIRIASATQNVADAQEKLAEAIAQYGPSSSEAEKAGKDLQKQQEALKKATEDAQIQFALMTASAVAQSGTLISTVIPRIAAFTASLKEAAVAEAVAAAAGGGVGSGTLTGVGSLGKAGKIMTGLGIVGGGIGLGAGIATSQAFSKDKQDFWTKLMNAGQQAGSGALLGATVGSVVPGLGTGVGAAIGGGLGLASGIASNFGGDISDMMSGKTQNNTFNIQGFSPADVLAEVERRLGFINTAGGQSH